MQPITEREFHLLADAVRRRHSGTCSSETLDALEHHAFRVAAYVDDLAEGESVNGMDYQVTRAAAILHDAAASKVRAGIASEASAMLATEMLESMGADEAFTAAVVNAVRRHAGARVLDDAEAGEMPESCADLLVHDACLLARMEAAIPGIDARETMRRLHAATAEMRTDTARRIAAGILATAEHGGALVTG